MSIRSIAASTLATGAAVTGLAFTAPQAQAATTNSCYVIETVDYGTNRPLIEPPRNVRRLGLMAQAVSLGRW